MAVLAAMAAVKAAQGLALVRVNIIARSIGQMSRRVAAVPVTVRAAGEKMVGNVKSALTLPTCFSGEII